MAELSIPGVDIQTDTNAFRFNCPYALTVTGLDLYLDQHTTSGNVTVTVTNTTDTASMITLSVAGTSTSATTSTVSNASCDSGDIITFAITATPANAQGLRANLKFTRTV
jgi:guanyl-specific ribonuclease Sa